MQQEGGKTSTVSIVCSLVGAWGGDGRAGPLFGVRVGLDPRVGQKVWLRRSAYSLGGITCRVHMPCFCSWLFGSDSWVLLIFLYLVIHNFPQLLMYTVILGFLIVPLYFVAQGDFCPGARTAAKDPRCQVQVCLSMLGSVKRGAGGGLVVKLCPTLVTPWTVACEAPLSMGILQVRVLELVAISFSRGSSRPRN